MWRPVIAIALVALAPTAHAGGGPATDAYEGIDDSAVDVHGLVDVYAADNVDDPRTGQSQLRAFDTTANEPALGWLRLRIAHRPDVVGFRVDLGIGDTADAYLADDPAAVRHPALSRRLSRVGEAFVTVVLPGDVALDVGKFDTPIGLEDNEGLTNWNYSRSFVFTWDEPSLHTGARATYAISPEVTVGAFWLNGWNANVLDGSTMRSYAAAARWKPDDRLEAVVVYAGGLERAPHDPAGLAFRNLVDAYVTFAITRTIAVAATADYTPQFSGAAGYARFTPITGLAGAVRVERFADGSSIATGTPQTLDEVTATIEGRRVWRGATFVPRLEYRRDHSSADVFDHAGSLERVQQTITLSLIAAR